MLCTPASEPRAQHPRYSFAPLRCHSNQARADDPGTVYLETANPTSPAAQKDSVERQVFFRFRDPDNQNYALLRLACLYLKLSLGASIGGASTVTASTTALVDLYFIYSAWDPAALTWNNKDALVPLAGLPQQRFSLSISARTAVFVGTLRVEPPMDRLAGLLLSVSASTVGHSGFTCGVVSNSGLGPALHLD